MTSFTGFSFSSRSFFKQITVSAAALMLTIGAAAQSGRPEPMAPMKQHHARVGALLETLGKTRTPTMSAISPDGTNVAWTVGKELHLTGLAPEGAAQDGAWDRVIS